jgi:hypothetical protein
VRQSCSFSSLSYSFLLLPELILSRDYLQKSTAFAMGHTDTPAKSRRASAPPSFGSEDSRISADHDMHVQPPYWYPPAEQSPDPLYCYPSVLAEEPIAGPSPSQEVHDIPLLAPSSSPQVPLRSIEVREISWHWYQGERRRLDRLRRISHEKAKMA